MQVAMRLLVWREPGVYRQPIIHRKLPKLRISTRRICPQGYD